MYVFVEVVHESYMKHVRLMYVLVQLMYVLVQHVHGTKIFETQFVIPLKTLPCTCLTKNSQKQGKLQSRHYRCWLETNGKRQMTGVFFRIPFAILSIILGLKLSVPSLYVCLVMGGSLSLVMI